MASVIHFEGIPGSGKSTAAEALCGLLRARGEDAFWVLEETRSHPALPDTPHRAADSSAFSADCLAAWGSFHDANQQLAILDGYAFQCTVRFMFADDLPTQQIHAYFRAWAEIDEGRSSLCFLMVDNVTQHYESIFESRGSEWTEKLLSYVAGTTYGRKNGLANRDGLIDFWSAYQDLCVELLQSSALDSRIGKARSMEPDDLLELATPGPAE